MSSSKRLTRSIKLKIASTQQIITYLFSIEKIHFVEENQSLECAIGKYLYAFCHQFPFESDISGGVLYEEGKEYKFLDTLERKSNEHVHNVYVCDISINYII